MHLEYCPLLHIGNVIQFSCVFSPSLAVCVRRATPGFLPFHVPNSIDMVLQS